MEIGKGILAGIAALIVGVTKAGFGGGLGLLATPICAIAFGARKAVGIMLPLLIAGDLISVAAYWRKWKSRLLISMLPGLFVGTVVGIGFLGSISPEVLNKTLGVIAAGFAVLQLYKKQLFPQQRNINPPPYLGLIFGIITGFTSTIAHAAGPVVAMYLVMLQLPKETFVATSVFIFAVVNWLKLPFYCIDQSIIQLQWLPEQSLINKQTLPWSLALMPIIPLGVKLGIQLNRWFSEEGFSKFIIWVLFFTGMYLLAGNELIRLLN